MAARYARVTGNWADTSTWAATAGGTVGASVPSLNDTAIIDTANKSGGAGAITVTLTGDVEVEGLELHSNNSSYDATLHTASEHTVTINDYEIGGYSAKIHGYTELTGNVNLTFTKAGAHTIIIDPTHQTNKVNDITVNHASNVLKCGSNVDIKGDLTVTAGTYNTNSAADGSGTDYALTVTGDVLIGAGSGTGDSAVLDGNASPIIINGGMKIDVTGKYDATTHANGTVINKYLAGGGLFALQLIAGGTFIHNDGLVHVTGTGGYSIVIEGLSGSDVSGTDANALHDLKVTLHSISQFVKLDPVPSSNGDTMIITGDLDIVEGKVHGNSTSDILTVNGNVTVRDGAQLSESTSVTGAMTFGSLTIEDGGKYIATSGTTTITSKNGDNAISQAGTFTHNDGIVLVTTAANCNIVWSAASQRLHELQVNLGHTARTCSVTGQFDSHRYVESDLTVTNCKLYANGATFKIAGDVSLATNATLQMGTSNTNAEFGSLDIASGTTYIATSGTTTITTATGAGSSSNRAAFCHASGTFTHNNGLFQTTAGNADVEFTSQSETNNPFYNFEATQYAIAATAPWVVLNNMTIANGFQFNGSSGYAKVLGIMKHTGGTYNASDVSSSTSHFFNHYRLEGGTLDLSNIDITVGSIRNTGGTIS